MHLAVSTNVNSSKMYSKLYAIFSSGDFKWYSGTPVTWTNWEALQPTSLSPACISQYWTIRTVTTSLITICEIVLNKTGNYSSSDRAF